MGAISCGLWTVCKKAFDPGTRGGRYFMKNKYFMATEVYVVIQTVNGNFLTNCAMIVAAFRQGGMVSCPR